MKILLDEQMTVHLKKFLIGDFEIFTLKNQGWLGVQNGELREKLNENNFTFLITAYKNLPFQQNLKKINFTIILIDTPTMSEHIQLLFVPKIQKLLDNPPAPLPKLVHISVVDISRGQKIALLSSLLTADELLFL